MSGSGKVLNQKERAIAGGPRGQAGHRRTEAFELFPRRRSEKRGSVTLDEAEDVKG